MNKFLVSQVISAILSFLMMICITVLATSICLSLTFFRPGFITERMNDKYYNLALDSLRQTLKDEIAPPAICRKRCSASCLTFALLKRTLRKVFGQYLKALIIS